MWGGRRAYLVVFNKFVAFLHASTEDNQAVCVRFLDEEAYVALRPIGLTFIMPLRNSMKVPLQKPSASLNITRNHQTRTA